MQIKIANGLADPPDYFLKYLHKYFGGKVTLTVQKNRANLLHIRKLLNSYQISMHHLFYEMEESLFASMLQLAQRGKKAKKASMIINAYIESKKHLVVRENKQGLTKGKVYDLEAVFLKVNQHYFQGKLDLFLTWTPIRKSSISVTLGSYKKGDPKGLIRVNRVLDSLDVPEYFVEFVVYHEALHDLFPVKMKEDRRVIHSHEFRIQEQLFEQYQLARKWEKQVFFKDKLR